MSSEFTWLPESEAGWIARWCQSAAGNVEEVERAAQSFQHIERAGLAAVEFGLVQDEIDQFTDLDPHAEVSAADPSFLERLEAQIGHLFARTAELRITAAARFPDDIDAERLAFRSAVVVLAFGRTTMPLSSACLAPALWLAPAALLACYAGPGTPADLVAHHRTTLLRMRRALETIRSATSRPGVTARLLPRGVYISLFDDVNTGADRLAAHFARCERRLAEPQPPPLRRLVGETRALIEVLAERLPGLIDAGEEGGFALITRDAVTVWNNPVGRLSGGPATVRVRHPVPGPSGSTRPRWSCCCRTGRSLVPILVRPFDPAVGLVVEITVGTAARATGRVPARHTPRTRVSQPVTPTRGCTRS